MSNVLHPRPSLSGSGNIAGRIAPIPMTRTATGKRRQRRLGVGHASPCVGRTEGDHASDRSELADGGDYGGGMCDGAEHAGPRFGLGAVEGVRSLLHDRARSDRSGRPARGHRIRARGRAIHLVRARGSDRPEPPWSRPRATGGRACEALRMPGRRHVNGADTSRWGHRSRQRVCQICANTMSFQMAPCARTESLAGPGCRSTPQAPAPGLGCSCRLRRGLSRYFLPVKNSLTFSPLNLAPSTTVWPMPVNISLNPRPT
jgi:hypothetical protein